MFHFASDMDSCREFKSPYRSCITQSFFCLIFRQGPSVVKDSLKHSVARAEHESLTLLLHPPKCWGYGLYHHTWLVCVCACVYI